MGLLILDRFGCLIGLSLEVTQTNYLVFLTHSIMSSHPHFTCSPKIRSFALLDFLLVLLSPEFSYRPGLSVLAEDSNPPVPPVGPPNRPLPPTPDDDDSQGDRTLIMKRVSCRKFFSQLNVLSVFSSLTTFTFKQNKNSICEEFIYKVLTQVVVVLSRVQDVVVLLLTGSNLASVSSRIFLEH